MKLRLIVCCLLLSIGSIWAKDDARKASEALIKRVIPEKASSFKVEMFQPKDGFRPPRLSELLYNQLHNGLVELGTLAT